MRKTEDEIRATLERLNESPSEKEGKSSNLKEGKIVIESASMKALPKRKGNPRRARTADSRPRLNESPSEKEGK